MNIPIIKDLPSFLEAKQFNETAVNTFMNQLGTVGAKAIICLGVDSENKIQLVFVEGVTLGQVKDLINQVSTELNRGNPLTDC